MENEILIYVIENCNLQDVCYCQFEKDTSNCLRCSHNEKDGFVLVPVSTGKLITKKR